MIGRYTKVRGWLADRCVTPPLLIDRRNGANTRITPCVEHGAQYEWDELADRYVRSLVKQRRDAVESILGRRNPVLAPMQIAGLWGRSELHYRAMFQTGPANISTLALDSAYTAGTSGDASGGRLRMPSAKTLDTVYFFVSSYTGTAANVNDINLELRPEASTGGSVPDTTTLTESKSVDPASATGWIASTGWTTAMSALERAWLIVADADGNGTDYATIGTLLNYLNYVTAQNQSHFLRSITTGGWASGNSTSTTVYAAFVVKFSDTTVFGDSITSSASPSSSTNQRGMLLATDAVVNAIDVFGFLWSSTSANISGGKIYQGTNGPASGADNTSTDIIYGASGVRTGFAPSGGGNYRFSPGTQYRVVITLSSATAAGPTKASIGTGADASLRAAMPGSGKWTWTIESGGAWSDDSDGLANLMFLLDADVAAAGGGGILIPQGMSGGFHG